MAIWISRESWQTVWSALHNIRVNMNPGIVQPVATLSGHGTATRVNIDLPTLSGSGDNSLLSVTGNAMERGTPVSLTGAIAGKKTPTTIDNCRLQCYRVAPAVDGRLPWGILEAALPADGQSSARFAGLTAAMVNIVDPAHRYAVPEQGLLTSGAAGGAAILWRQNSNGPSLCLLNLTGADSGGAYQGPFLCRYDAINRKLTVAEGYLLRNGELLLLPAVTDIEPKAGTLCLCSSLAMKDGKGQWNQPIYAVTTPSPGAIPIAEISVRQTVVSIRQLCYGMAIINQTRTCALAEY